MPDASGEPVAIVLTVIGGFCSALLFGGMVMFAGVFARIAFAHLPRATAASFMRAAFSSYYIIMAVLAGAAALALAWPLPLDAAALAAVLVGFVLARQWLMPAAHRLEEEREAGLPGAAERFGTIHGRSVLLNFVQILAVTIVLGRLLIGGAA